MRRTGAAKKIGRLLQELPAAAEEEFGGVEGEENEEEEGAVPERGAGFAEEFGAGFGGGEPGGGGAVFQDGTAGAAGEFVEEGFVGREAGIFADRARVGDAEPVAGGAVVGVGRFEEPDAGRGRGPAEEAGAALLAGEGNGDWI